MSEISEQLKRRTMRFALDACSSIKHLPPHEPGPTVKRQLAKSSTGIAFNYRSACRARSHTEFTARIAIVAEEADESYGWLEFIDEGKLLFGPELDRLVAESDELSAIFSASLGTARRKEQNARGRKKHPSADSATSIDSADSANSITQSPDHPITRSHRLPTRR